MSEQTDQTTYPATSPELPEVAVPGTYYYSGANEYRRCYCTAYRPFRWAYWQQASDPGNYNVILDRLFNPQPPYFAGFIPTQTPQPHGNGILLWVQTKNWPTPTPTPLSYHENTVHREGRYERNDVDRIDLQPPAADNTDGRE